MSNGFPLIYINNPEYLETIPLFFVYSPSLKEENKNINKNKQYYTINITINPNEFKQQDFESNLKKIFESNGIEITSIQMDSKDKWNIVVSLKNNDESMNHDTLKNNITSTIEKFGVKPNEIQIQHINSM